MKKIVTLTTLMLMFFCLNLHAALSTEEITFISKSSGRLLVAEIYYPTSCKVEKKKIQHGIWIRENYVRHKTCTHHQKKYPLIIFSHGFQGDRFGHSWLAESLVTKGYIVVMIDHTLNTSYEHSDLFTYTAMWQRPLDMSELLTYLLEESQWRQFINKSKIGVAGFSLGGTTALWLSGVKADKDKFKQIMDRKYARWSDWPKDATEKARSVDWSKGQQSYKDDRIKAVIAMAPDLGEAFVLDGLKKADVPVLVIVGDKDPVTPQKENAGFYATGIKGAELLIIKGADHFTFMNKCSVLGKQITPSLCASDNIKPMVHTMVIDKISRFLEKSL